MSTQLFEAAGALAGLPKHWIKFLTARHGKGYSYEGAGENSKIIPMKIFDPGKIRKELKDANNLAVIGKVEGEPVFMITKHDYYDNKYRVFEVGKGVGTHDSMGQRYHNSRGRSKTEDSYNINEVIDLLDKLFQAQGKSYNGMTVEVITKDPNRAELIKTRRSYKQLPDDPLHRKEQPKWRDPDPTDAQIQRTKKYADLKRPKLDAQLQGEKDKIKQQINAVLDETLDVIIQKVKDGYTYEINKTKLGEQLLKVVDISGISRLAKAYSTLRSTTSDLPHKIAKQLKNSGLV